MKQRENLHQYYPETYQDWLFGALGIKPGDEITPELLEPLYTLNRAWVGSEYTQNFDYTTDDTLVRAYTIYYMTINMPKIWFLLDRCPVLIENPFAEPRTDTICDMGCGPGTFIWATLFYLLERHPDHLRGITTIRGIDSSPKMIAIAERLATELQRYYPAFKHIRFEFEQCDWKQRCDGDCNWRLFGNTLIEGSFDDLNWARTMKADVVWLIEPGTSFLFHKTLSLRDSLIDGGWHVQFPCTSHHPCPMARDNWCHFHVNRFVLPFIQRMSDKAGRINPRHNFTGFVFTRQGRAGPEPSWRVLSPVRRQSRSAIRYLCDGRQMIETVLNRRDKSDENRVFITVDTGGRIAIESGLDSVEITQSKRINRTDSVRVF